MGRVHNLPTQFPFVRVKTHSVCNIWLVCRTEKSVSAHPCISSSNSIRARLTDTSQTLNLDELARVAKKYGLSVSVIGAADSMTGTASVNNVLSASRADYIAEELIKRGVSGDKITKTHQGGISDYAPNEANRHTKVMLHLK